MARNPTKARSPVECHRKIIEIARQSDRMISDKTFIQDLVSIFVQRGLKHVVVSPGSRHAPLSISFFHHPKVKVHVVPDERSSGYFALGIAQHIQTPVGVICTSGTAAANYVSAAAEAFYQEVPLIFMTADRPEEWVDQGDGQTIRQKGILGHHILGSYQLQQDVEHPDVRWYNQRSLNEAWNIANGIPRGPVHLNVPLREPLYGFVEPIADIEHLTLQTRPEITLPADQAKLLKSKFQHQRKVLLITGQHHPDQQLQEAVASFARLENVVVLTETTSNTVQGEVIASIDRLIMTFDEEDRNAFMPELLITFGSSIISKKIKALLRTAPHLTHWHIDPCGRTVDTFQRLGLIIQAEIAQTLAVLSEVVVESDYHDRWVEKDRELGSAFPKIAEELGWSDLLVFRHVLNRIPLNSILQMGNSSVVRYIQLFNPRTDISYFGNRGTSGIDGCTSTASGMASVSDKIVTLITGDIAFFYDLNGLWHNSNRQHLRIILINNGGGNIFKIIDGPSASDALEDVFEAAHEKDASHLAAHHSLNYLSASNEDQLMKGLEELYRSEQSGLLEVMTRGISNESILKESFKISKQRNLK